MKRIFTSFLMLAATFVSSSVVAVEPEYAIPQDWNNDRSVPTERLLYGMTIKGATKDGQASPYTVKLNERGGSQKHVFVDKTSEIIDLSANDVIKVDLEHGIEWMHSYLYIDYNHDGTFDENTELVSYSFYSENDENWGYDSANNFKKNGNATLDLPAFTVPADAQSVTTRMRLKIDWNSKNPIGNPNQSIGANRGSIFDFTVNIHGAAPVVEKYVVNVEDPDGATLSLTNAEGVEVVSGSEVEKGSVLTMAYELEDPAMFQFNGFIVNDVEQQESTFTVNGATTVSANVTLKTYPVNIATVEGGSILVESVNAVTNEKTPMTSGEEVAMFDLIAITATPAEGYELKNVLINDQVKPTEELGEILIDSSIIKDGKINISAEFAQKALSYDTPQGDRNKRIGTNGNTRYTERLIHNVTINGATLNGELKPFTSTINNPSNGYQEEVYLDHTAETVDLTAGDEITIDLKHNIEWMHSYLYIDYDHDGVFNQENELVAYSFYSTDESSSRGQNSVGDIVLNNINPSEIPAFTVDVNAKDVTTRMRLKIDWNSKDPVGNPAQSIGENAGTIIDFTANIHTKPAVAKFPVTLKPAVNGVYTVKDANGEVITDGMEVAAGTELSIEAVADEGYEVDQILVNNKPVTAGEKVVVSGATTIEVTFKEAVKQWAVNIHASKGGTVAVVDQNAVEYYDGSKIADGTMIEGIQILIEPEYNLVSLIVNGSEEVNNVFYAPNNTIILMYSKEIHGDININAEFSAPETGIGEAAMAEAAYSAEAQSLNIPAGAYAVVYNAAGQQVMNVQGGQTVSTSSLANGAYIVRVVAEGSVKVIKFVQK